MKYIHLSYNEINQIFLKHKRNFFIYIYLFQKVLFHPKVMVDFDVVNFLVLDGDVPRPTCYGFIFFNLFDLLECLVMWLTSMLVIQF